MHVNDQAFTAYRGEVLLDAALINGIDLPHDCRSGQCGTCTVRVLQGQVYGGACDQPNLVRACQARVISDVEILVEAVPDVVTTKGMVMGVTPLAPDVLEVRIRPARPVSFLPGQYCKFQFRGFPWRCFSLTAPLDQPFDRRSIRLHVRKMPGGRVTQAMGRGIKAGHAVRIRGPFGSAYLRTNLTNRLVLVGGGTGFAPIWSIADAAVTENPDREMVIIVGARELQSLYMASAFRRLASYPNVTLIPTTDIAAGNAARLVRTGRPTDFMPQLSRYDIVYGCGVLPLVDAVKEKALRAGASFYADPFVAQDSEDQEDIVSRALAWLDRVSPVPLTSLTGRREQPRMLPKPEQPRQSAYSPPITGRMSPAPMQGHFHRSAAE